MSVFSGTYAPARPEVSNLVVRDAISTARDQLRQASQLPFHGSTHDSWCSLFIGHITDARANLRRHIWLVRLEDSPLNQAERAEPRLCPQSAVQRQEQDDLAEALDGLAGAAMVAGPIDIWRMIELGEQAILLELALARHQTRLSQLLFEATQQDVGGEG